MGVCLLLSLAAAQDSYTYSEDDYTHGRMLRSRSRSSSSRSSYSSSSRSYSSYSYNSYGSYYGYGGVLLVGGGYGYGYGYGGYGGVYESGPNECDTSYQTTLYTTMITPLNLTDVNATAPFTVAEANAKITELKAECRK